MNDDEYLKMLRSELSWVMLFFKSVSELKLELPEIKISREVKDSAWYSDEAGTIFINPDYNHENLEPVEMVAHEFFHHAQNEALWKREVDEATAKILEANQELLGELAEGTAFLFAGLYMEKSTKKVNLLEYMSDKRHSTGSGIGNGIALLMFEKSGMDAKKYVKNALDYRFIAEAIAYWADKTI